MYTTGNQDGEPRQGPRQGKKTRKKDREPTQVTSTGAKTKNGKKTIKKTKSEKKIEKNLTSFRFCFPLIKVFRTAETVYPVSVISVNGSRNGCSIIYVDPRE